MKPLDLKDHQLWPDGVITVSPEKLPEYLQKLSSLGTAENIYQRLAVTELTKEVEDFNILTGGLIKVKQDINLERFTQEWLLPEKYKYLNLGEYLISLADRIEKDSLYEKRLIRLAEEILLFRNSGLDDVLKVLIYIVDQLTEKKIVWGVGRGSSCSSYLLYLLGLHEVDAVKYDIEITDFIRT